MVSCPPDRNLEAQCNFNNMKYAVCCLTATFNRHASTTAYNQRPLNITFITKYVRLRHFRYTSGTSAHSELLIVNEVIIKSFCTFIHAEESLWAPKFCRV